MASRDDHDAASGGRKPPQQSPRVHHRMTHSQKGGASRVAKDQGVVVRLREQEVAAVRAPARRILQRVLREAGEQAQALRHPSQLAVLLPLGVEQELLHGGGRACSWP